MAEALRRLLWLAPLLAVTSGLLFALFSWGTPAPAGNSDLPLFLNTEPRGIRQQVSRVVAELTHGDSHEAARQLASFGGAGLPFVLPELERHDAEVQERLAVALMPIARRTGVLGEERDWEDPKIAVAFWTRFWRDRALDFQPTVVSRLVRRVGARSLALGGTDLIQLDTYALPQLIAQLGKVRTTDDVARVRRLLRIISEITGQRWVIAPHTSPDEARRTVTECRRWWDEQRSHYTDITGLQRITATVTQTLYGRWVLRSLREVTGLDTSVVGETLLRRARITGILLLCCMVGAGLVATLAAAAIRASRIPPIIVRLGGAAAVALIVPALVLWPPVHWPGGALGTACVVSVILGAIPALHLNQRTLGIVLAPHEEDTYRQRLARLARAALRATPLWAPLAFGESLTLVFALEWSTGLQGVGPLTIQALKTGDVPWLMALCLGLGALTALVQIIADAAVQFGTPRARRSEA